MYESYYNFSGSPFALTSNPEIFFGTRTHNKAMAYLHYGVRQGNGSIVITGQSQSGKTILIDRLVNQLDQSRTNALRLSIDDGQNEIGIADILSAAKVNDTYFNAEDERERLIEYLHGHLNRGRRTLLLVDDAHRLTPSSLMFLNDLSHIDYMGTPLLQNFFLGNRSLGAILAEPELTPFRQEIIASYELETLDDAEMRRYIEHRLGLAGWSVHPIFSAESFEALFKYSGGHPGAINELCDLLLTLCAEERIHNVSELEVEKAQKRLMQAHARRHEKSRESRVVKAELADILPSLQSMVGDRARVGTPAENGATANAAAPIEKGPVILPFPPARKLGIDEIDAENTAAASERTESGHEQARASQVDDQPELKELENMRKKENGSSDNSANNPFVQGDLGDLSVLDRLKVRNSQPLPETTDAPKPATIGDVADAIAAVSTSPVGGVDDAEDELDFIDNDIRPPMGYHDAKSWREALIQTIDDTRGEIKEAESNMLKMRRTLKEIERRRRERNSQIEGNIKRAEKLVAEINAASR